MKSLEDYLYIFVKILSKYKCEILIFGKFGGTWSPRLYVVSFLFIISTFYNCVRLTHKITFR